MLRTARLATIPPAGRVTEEDVRCMEDWANEVEWYVVKETEWGPDRWELWTPGMSCRVTE